VVVATCGPHRPGELPEITYQSGGLENAEMRKQVCEILEGGEAAFKDRARRLRVKPVVPPSLRRMTGMHHFHAIHVNEKYDEDT